MTFPDTGPGPRGVTPLDDLTREYSRVNLSSDPIHGYIQITKGGHGGVRGSTCEQDLVDSPWVQRLRRIHQLQSAWWVFATAEHSRFQHSLGAMHLAGRWALHLYPTLRAVHPDVPSAPVVSETLRLAGLLHDVGHGPFGHFFDENYLLRWAIDHEDISRALILDELAPLIAGIGASPEHDFEPGTGIDARWVAFLISKSELPGFDAPPWLRVLKPVLTGPFSADNLDYVPRDAYICGVAGGSVDVARILHYTFISPDGLTMHQHGSEALFMFLSARLYLYHQVYFHRTVRRIDLQLREIFGPTINLLLGGNPLEHRERFRLLNEWYLMNEVDRWAGGADGPEKAKLGRAWSAIVGRRFKWRLVHSAYLEVKELGTARADWTVNSVAAAIRAALPDADRDVEFQVDVASQTTQAINPLTETVDVVFYNPLTRACERTPVLDLFRRLPGRFVLCRVFAREGSDGVQLARAAGLVLGPPTAGEG